MKNHPQCKYIYAAFIIEVWTWEALRSSGGSGSKALLVQKSHIWYADKKLIYGTKGKLLHWTFSQLNQRLWTNLYFQSMNKKNNHWWRNSFWQILSIQSMQHFFVFQWKSFLAILMLREVLHNEVAPVWMNYYIGPPKPFVTSFESVFMSEKCLRPLMILLK